MVVVVVMAWFGGGGGGQRCARLRRANKHLTDAQAVDLFEMMKWHGEMLARFDTNSLAASRLAGAVCVRAADQSNRTFRSLPALARLLAC